MKIILASQSPRRKELLARLIDDFDVIVADVDESLYHYHYYDLAYELSKLKAYEIFKSHPDDLIIASDTIVILEGKVFEKPRDHEDARQMIKALQGRTHQVITSYTLISKNQEITRSITTDVLFRQVDDNEIDEYIKTKIPYDKSGGYGIQNPDFNFVKSYDGELENVMGLPIREIAKDLETHFKIKLKTR